MLANISKSKRIIFGLCQSFFEKKGKKSYFCRKCIHIKPLFSFFMKKYSVLFSFLALCAASASAQITWANNIAPIMYAHCTSCHHTGGIGGFPLMTYAEASVPYIDISNAVSTKQMPPWMPDPNYRHFKDENVLSQSEIDDINAWIGAGKPEGNPANAPTPPVYNPGSQLAQVDKTLQIPNFTVTATIDQYRSFVIPSGFTASKHLGQIEYIPGNPAIVHHIVFYYDTSPTSAMLDQLDPLPGFESYGVGPISNSGVWLGAWAPGQGPMILPQNMGMKIPAGADFVIEVHYAPNSQGQVDNSSINVAYTPPPATGAIREVYTDPVLNYQNDITNGPLFIPANTVKTFYQQTSSGNTDISLIGIFPHMHKVGTSYKVYAQKSSTITPLIDIPKWDFYWQGYYTVQSLLKIPANSILYGIATYDNTTNNPDNPSNPPQDVSSGEHTTDEMMITFVTYTNYQTGDENIILDSTLLTTGISQGLSILPLEIAPNPAQNQLTFSISLPKKTDIHYMLTDVLGKVVLQGKKEGISAGDVSQKIDIQNLSKGHYFLRVDTEAGYAVKKVVKE